MTLPPPFVPKPVRPCTYVYGVYDKTTDPKTLIKVELSRSEARKFVTFAPDADSLVIRRARLTPYES